MNLTLADAATGASKALDGFKAAFDAFPEAAKIALGCGPRGNTASPEEHDNAKAILAERAPESQYLGLSREVVNERYTGRVMLHGTEGPIILEAAEARDLWAAEIWQGILR